MKINIIAAIAANGCIGLNGDIPWYIPEDLKRFKQLTMGKPVIMGRKTYESIGDVLEGRYNCVLTRKPDELYKNTIDDDPSKLLGWNGTLPALLRVLEGYRRTEEVFVIGGAQIYTEALDKDIADRMYITRINQDFTGDTFFPEFDKNEWELIRVTPMQHKDLSYQFETWERKR